MVNFQKYERQIEELLRSFLKTRGHYSSGKLSSSVKVKITLDSGVPVPIISANDYIQFLNDGKFLSDFFALESFSDIIGDIVIDTLLD